MKKTLLIIGLLALVGVYALIRFFHISISSIPSNTDFVSLPEGFAIDIFAENLGDATLATPGPSGGPRLMGVKGNNVFVAIPKLGSVIVLTDANSDFKVDEQKVFISGLKNPHSVDFYKDWIYIATEDSVVRVKDMDNDNVADSGSLEKIMDLSPGSHWTRTAHIINDSLFVATGSTCNVCHETDAQRATIQKCDVNGKNCEVFARGLRNTVDFVEHNGKIYGADNGRDMLGNTIPPDELNVIEEGKNYGWPICYGKNIHDTEFDKNTYIRNPCMEPFEKESFIDLPAHIAPLGIAAYSGTEFPSEYQGNIFVAYHGSWNANPPVGYKIVRINLDTKSVTDFATGWLDGTTVKGRPVGIVNFHGSLLVSDDTSGKIYRIYYTK